MVLSRCHTFGNQELYDLFFDRYSIANAISSDVSSQQETRMSKWSWVETGRIIL